MPDVACYPAGQFPHSWTSSRCTWNTAAPVWLHCREPGMLWASHYSLPGDAGRKNKVQGFKASASPPA